MTPTTSKIRAKVYDRPALVRDMSSNAVINTNSTDYHRRLAIKNSISKKNEEMETLKNEVSELKELVQQLLAKN